MLNTEEFLKCDQRLIEDSLLEAFETNEMALVRFVDVAALPEQT